MKVEEGIVIETAGNKAMIKPGKHDECVCCGVCPGTDSPIFEADNRIGAKVGQRVLYEVVDTYKIKSALIIFAAPLIAAFLGVIAGGEIAEVLTKDMLTGRIAGGATAFFITVIIIKIYDNYIGKKKNSLPEIKSIVR